MQSHIRKVVQEAISYIILISDDKNVFIYYGSGYESISDTNVINDYNLLKFFTLFFCLRTWKPFNSIIIMYRIYFCSSGTIFSRDRNTIVLLWILQYINICLEANKCYAVNLGNILEVL